MQPEFVSKFRVKKALNMVFRSTDISAEAREKIEKAIDDIPKADVAPAKRGKWKGYTHSRFCGLDTESNPIYRDGVLYYCSECSRRSIIKTNFCPSCGAKMDEEET